MPRKKAENNRSIELTSQEVDALSARLTRVTEPTPVDAILNKAICQDLFEALPFLPDSFADLIIADPPYNMAKDFNGKAWKKMPLKAYEHWLSSWIPQMQRILKPSGSIYICGDWVSSSALHNVMSEHFHVKNRITWEREKGRGSLTNWKNSSEDIWFATAHNKTYTFNVDSVKLKKRVIAPYRDSKGNAKDWVDSGQEKFRLTHPSNLWTDISVPFWSMPENTPHPTQKPEKLVAKIILASSNAGDVVFDPFLGSGTTCVTAAKLGRKYVGVELNKEFACYALKRLDKVLEDNRIQGYHDGVFYERNSKPE